MEEEGTAMRRRRLAVRSSIAEGVLGKLKDVTVWEDTGTATLTLPSLFTYMSITLSEVQ